MEKNLSNVGLFLRPRIVCLQFLSTILMEVLEESERTEFRFVQKLLSTRVEIKKRTAPNLSCFVFEWR